MSLEKKYCFGKSLEFWIQKSVQALFYSTLYYVIFVCTEAERDRSRTKRKLSKKSPPKRENEARERQETKQERKPSSSKDEEIEGETGRDKSSETKEADSSDIKVKTLEQILREKAIKKMEERRALSKDVKPDEDKETKEEEDFDESSKDTVKDEEEESHVDDAENSKKSPLKKVVRTKTKGDDPQPSSEKSTSSKKVSSMVKKVPPKKVISLNNDDNNTLNTSSEKTRTLRKVSSNNEKNWPLRKIMSTVNKDNNSVQSSAVAEKHSIKDEDEGSGEEKESKGTEPPSPFQEVRVKTFEEIMELKRKRRAAKEASENAAEEMTVSTTEESKSTTNLVLSPPKRLKRIVRKSSDDGDKQESKAESSQGAEKPRPVRKRTVFVMEKPAPSKQNTEDGELCFCLTCCRFGCVLHNSLHFSPPPNPLHFMVHFPPRLTRFCDTCIFLLLPLSNGVHHAHRIQGKFLVPAC